MEDFFRDLRALRVQAGLSIDELAERANFPADILAAAETGPEVPSNPVLVAFVRACGGPVGEWEDRWRIAAAEVLAVAARGTRSRRGRLAGRLAVGIAAAALLIGGSVALLARPAEHIAPSAVSPHPPNPKPRSRPTPGLQPQPTISSLELQPTIASPQPLPSVRSHHEDNDGDTDVLAARPLRDSRAPAPRVSRANHRAAERQTALRRSGVVQRPHRGASSCLRRRSHGRRGGGGRADGAA